ncbi:hypothetical protein V8F20_012758 [Naviculisporaceae sp. PSN 640]
MVSLRVADLNFLTSENCREQHLKCDRVTPICGRCQNAGRECRRTGLRVRETKEIVAKYSKTQKWVKTPKRIVFIHETNIANETEGLSPDSGPEDYLEVDLSGSSETVPDNPSRRSSLQSPIKSCSMTPVSPRFPRDAFAASKQHPSYEETLNTASPYPRPDHQPSKQKGSSEDYEGRSVKENSPSDRFLRQPGYVDDSIPPLTELERAMLIRHFVQKLAVWLDLCDPNLSFQTIVPQRARRCSILLNSILALAGRHLAHVSKTFPDVYRIYSKECITRLCNWGGNEDLQEQEDVFAATVILRVMAELEATDKGGQLDGHFLSGLRLCVQNQRTILKSGSLGAAAYWVGLRQEIYNAIANHEQVSMLKEDVLPDIIKHSMSSADDYTWANRAVVHCAEVLNYCFDQPHRKLRHRWEELMRWNRDWTRGTVANFSPIYEAPDTTPFPEIWYTQSCHVIGTQHHLLAQLFLEHCHPDMPTVGVPLEQAKRDMKPKLQKIVRKICGIGLGNPWTPPSMFTACMAIHAFGDLFTDLVDQREMLNILQRTQAEHGRPTLKVQKEMVHMIWRWNVPPDYLMKQEYVKDESLSGADYR